MNTVKQTNASRFFKGYQKKLAQHKEEVRDHYKQIYEGGVIPNENDVGKTNKPLRRPRPQTAKSAVRGPPPPTSGGKTSLTRNRSYKSIRDFSPKSQRSVKSNLSKVYGEHNEKLLQYEKEKELLRKRDETKAELKALLKQYVA